MPKSVQGRLLFAALIVGLLLIIGRNVYRHAREAAFDLAVSNGEVKRRAVAVETGRVR